jgi:mono/diheme cytochrome c family protein
VEVNIMRRIDLLLPALCTVLLGAPQRARADEGEDLFKSICSDCHTPENHPLDSVRLTRQKWKEQLEKMVTDQNADIPTGKKREALLDYLEKNKGPLPGADAKPTDKPGSTQKQGAAEKK